MFVVERSSTGADILYLIVPAGKGCLVVRLLCGSEEAPPTSDRALLRLLVKALEREDMMADEFDVPIQPRQGRKEGRYPLGRTEAPTSLTIIRIRDGQFGGAGDSSG
jgi:hypothetical protein